MPIFTAMEVIVATNIIPTMILKLKNGLHYGMVYINVEMIDGT